MLHPGIFELPPVFNQDTVQQRLNKIRDYAALVCFKYVLAQPVIVAVVEADQLAHEESIKLASRFDQAVLEMLEFTGKFGGTRLSVTGVILFTFFDHALASSFIEETQEKCKIGHFWKKTWVLPWIVDIPNKEIRPHAGLPVTLGDGVLCAHKLVEDVFGASEASIIPRSSCEEPILGRGSPPELHSLCCPTAALGRQLVRDRHLTNPAVGSLARRKLGDQWW